VGDEGALLRIPWVQPQVGLRQVKAALESDFDQIRELLWGESGIAKANRKARCPQFRGCGRQFPGCWLLFWGCWFLWEESGCLLEDC
jgi:hypothetical protein